MNKYLYKYEYTNSTYNSNAIEGHTLTLIETKIVLEGINDAYAGITPLIKYLYLSNFVFREIFNNKNIVKVLVQ
jgi:hypothetical protein